MNNTITTETETTTAHKISVGLMVATATVVVLATLAAAIYTIATNAKGGASFIRQAPSTATQPVLPTPGTDRSFTLPQ